MAVMYRNRARLLRPPSAANHGRCRRVAALGGRQVQKGHPRVGDSISGGHAAGRDRRGPMGRSSLPRVPRSDRAAEVPIQPPTARPLTNENN